MPRLLIIHHTPSRHCQEMFEAVVAGATDPEIQGVKVIRRPALTASPVEMLEADGYLQGSPANLAARQRGHQGSRARPRRDHDRPWLVQAAETAVVSGKPGKADIEACWNLGATVAAQLTT